jgi:hypothetical protein
MSTKTLEQRIADAFSTSNITSHTLNQLLGETETAITAADADAFKMKSRRSIRSRCLIQTRPGPRWRMLNFAAPG